MLRTPIQFLPQLLRIIIIIQRFPIYDMEKIKDMKFNLILNLKINKNENSTNMMGINELIEVIFTANGN